MKKDIVILAGARTPFGAFGGSLKDLSAIELGALASVEALKRGNVDPSEIDHVIFGNALQTSADAIYFARHAGLKAGTPNSVPALTVNRLCGSGFQSIINGAEQILLDEAEIVLAGGAESMSQAPHIIRGARWGLPLAQSQLEDYLWAALYDSYCGLSMALTAEKLAEIYKISRDEVDEFALRSQIKAKEAINAGRLKDEIVPVAIKTRKGDVVFDTDEHPKPNTTAETLAKLKAHFKKDGVITAGNASGISDGAAAAIVTTAEKAKEKGVKPLGRLVSWGIAGVDPSVMGIGPVESSKAALAKAGMTLDKIDLIEINEAFSPQYIAVEKELGIDREKANVNGGAIAIGHPLAASGTRLTLTILYELKRRGKKYGLAGACIGGGQGISVIVEAL